jgi:hypothetical protein
MDRLCGLVVIHWLQIQRSVFDSRRHQIFCEVVGLERGPLSLVSTTEELTEEYVEQRSSVLPVRYELNS